MCCTNKPFPARPPFRLPESTDGAAALLSGSLDLCLYISAHFPPFFRRLRYNSAFCTACQCSDRQLQRKPHAI
ncbi:hypothetical protein HMPREF9371_2288 [Neisseria shayeganii 871]|uniref:Uncharacterized protein n=1 Tax=Neisseria shayeganii 871 TaxID=1032488 RepID=G4CKZ7_9NEIS|nr:hypothetical protein HMPREF9371_2288 [Neisseria shayeganii 871]